MGKYGRVLEDLDGLAAHVGNSFDGVPVLLAGLQSNFLSGTFREAACRGGAVVLDETGYFAAEGCSRDSRGAVLRREDRRECGGR